MKNKFKKIGLIIALIIIIVGIVFVVVNSSSGKKEEKTSVANSISKVTGESDNIEIENTSRETKATTVTTLSDGVKYSVTDEEIAPEVVLGDNYFDTQIADINFNFDQYENKTIEIEGLYFENPFEDTVYTFVGRYSISNMCPTCPAGYSYFEYEWHGDEISLTDSDTWIKIIGTLKKGFDGVEYYYIDAQSIEVMNEKGLETVSN